MFTFPTQAARGDNDENDDDDDNDDDDNGVGDGRDDEGGDGGAFMDGFLMMWEFDGYLNMNISQVQGFGAISSQRLCVKGCNVLWRGSPTHTFK